MRIIKEMKNKEDIKVWKALYVSSRAELKVRERLESKGMDCYVPCRKVMKQWSDRKKMITQPLLPGYVFVRIDEQEVDRSTVLNTQGVVAFVRNIGKDAVITEKEITTLKSIEKLGYETSFIHQNIAKGDTIEIKQGVFKNLKAQVLDVNKDGTIYAFLLESIHLSVKVLVPKDIAVII